MRNGLLGFAIRMAMGRQNDLIYNGSPATITEAPFMAYLRTTYANDTEMVCSASIISERVILTAAHCVLDKNKSVRAVCLLSLYFSSRLNFSNFL